MKRYLLILLSLLAIATGAKADVEINSENFPDANFRSFLLAQDYGKDGKLTDAEIAGISALNLTGKSIASLRGIKYFTALTTLRIWVNQIGEAEMEHVVRELPYQSSATMFVYNPFVTAEQNRMNSLQYYVAREKGWISFCNSDPTNMYEIPMDMLAYPFAPTIVAVNIDEKTFPDANFRQFLIDEGYGCQCTSLNQRYLTFEDIEGITTLDVSNMGINSLTGIQFFTALEELDCAENALTALDVSNNKALTELDCDLNHLSSLDMSMNTTLRRLTCSENNLTSLDVSENMELESLYCQNNNLTTLDVSNNTKIYTLYCYSNALTTLDLSKNTELEFLYCSVNNLTSLNVSKNEKLKYLNCYSNQIKGAYMDLLIASLPQNNSNKERKFVVKSESYFNEDYNVCTTQQVLDALHRGWTAYYFDYKDYKEKLFNGSDEVTPMKGDVNNDGTVDVADIATVIDVMAGGASSSLKGYADVNNDKTIDVADIASIIDIMARQ